MNGGVSCTQFDCDVDEHVIFSRVAQDVMHAAKNTWQLVVDLSCFPDVLVVSSCRSETTTFDQKSSVVDFRKSTWR